jgi:hypothetical protein
MKSRCPLVCPLALSLPHAVTWANASSSLRVTTNDYPAGRPPYYGCAAGWSRELVGVCCPRASAEWLGVAGRCPLVRPLAWSSGPGRAVLQHFSLLLPVSTNDGGQRWAASCPVGGGL